MLIHRLALDGLKKLFNLTSTILEYGLDLAWRGSPEILHLIWVISFHAFFKAEIRAATFLYLFRFGHCKCKLQKCPTLKIAWDKITQDEVRDTCTAAPCKIMAVVKNEEGYSE